LRDGDIRAPLHRWLERAHADCPGTGIIHELKLPRGSARIDLAVINDELCGFEIKSDVDSLVRLPRQSRAFNAVFDQVWVVTTERHLAAALARIPEWWGVLTPSTNRWRRAFRTERLAGSNPSPSGEAALQLLTRDEIIAALERRECAAGLRSKPRSYLIPAALERLSAATRDEVRAALKARARDILTPRQVPHS
jgi:hypothetical protein